MLTCSVFILAVTDLRGWLGSGDFGALLDPSLLVAYIFVDGISYFGYPIVYCG